MIFSTPSGCPSAETANERMMTALNAARTAATDTTPTLTIRLKHPERNLLLSKRVGESSPSALPFQYPTRCRFIHRQLLYSQKHSQDPTMCRLLLVADREFIQAENL
jgi:hypothetical protein